MTIGPEQDGDPHKLLEAHHNLVDEILHPRRSKFDYLTDPVELDTLDAVKAGYRNLLEKVFSDQGKQSVSVTIDHPADFALLREGIQRILSTANDSVIAGEIIDHFGLISGVRKKTIIIEGDKEILRSQLSSRRRSVYNELKELREDPELAHVITITPKIPRRRTLPGQPPATR